MKKNKNIFIAINPKSFTCPDLLSGDGFSFIEIIITLAIILTLTVSVGLLAFRYVGQGNIAATKTQIQTYIMAINTYSFDNGVIPSQEQGLKALWIKPTGNPEPRNWRGPYIDKEPINDPWGNPFRYIVPGPNNLPFGIESYGADGQEGGNGDAQDLNSWS